MKVKKSNLGHKMNILDKLAQWYVLGILNDEYAWMLDEIYRNWNVNQNS